MNRYPAHRTAAILLLICLAATPAYAILGDVNNDGALDNADIVLVENHLTGKALLSAAAQATADINQNSQVDVGDVIGLAKLQAGSARIVPNVVFEMQARAESLLIGAGLTKGQVFQIKSDAYTGSVVGQVPQYGQAVAPGSAVDLYVSAGASGGAYLEISPTEVDLGKSGTQATFQVKCKNGNLRWKTGMWADYVSSPASGTGNGTVTLTLDRTRLPYGKMSLTFAVVPDVSSSATGAYATVNLEQTVYPPPTLDAIHSWTPFSAGDTISIDGSSFAQNAADNRIEVNGQEVAASSVYFSPPNVTFTVPPTVAPGMIEIRARRAADASLGASPWSRPIVTRLVAPTEITLSPGVDGNSLWVEQAWQTYQNTYSGYELTDRSVGPADWLLGGTNLTRVNGANANEVVNPPVIGGSSEKVLVVEVSVDGQTYYLPARALSDTQLVVQPQKMMNNRAQFFARITPGKALRARLWGSEKGTYYPRASNWINLTVATAPPAIGSVIQMQANGLTLSGVSGTLQDSTIVQVAKSSTLFIVHDVYDSMTLRAAGLWTGDIAFLGQSDYTNPGYSTKQVLLNTPGKYTIKNLTSGKSRILEVVDGGVPYQWFSTADYVRLYSTINNLVLPPNAPVNLFADGAQAYIPSSAVQTVAGQTNLVTFTYSVLADNSYTLSDPAADDGKERVELFFRRADMSAAKIPTEWEPDSLLKPITIKQYYSAKQALNGPPSLAALDPDSGIYWDLPCTINTAKRLITLVLPAGTYSSPASEAIRWSEELAGDMQAAAAPAGFPPVRLYQITRNMGIPYLTSTHSVMKDPDNHFAVDYISDSSSSCYVTDAYAQGILDTLVATYDNFKTRGWRVPDGTTYIYLRKTLFGGYGSTTKGVFGRPTITINIAECPIGSVAYYTTASHEVGHVFQRNYTTNIVAKWFDEASAEWIALDTVGAAHFSTENLNDALPFISTLPLGFTFGYSTAEGYAAAPWPVWLSAHYGECIRKVYEALDGDPLAWENHRGTVGTACGKSIQRLYRDFARDYWLQNFAPVDTVDLHALMVAAGKTVALTMTDTGDLSFSDSRPILSSIRFSVQPNQACLDKFVGRSAVVRFSCNADAALSEVSVYGDRMGATSIPNQPATITTFSAPTSGFHVLTNLATHKTYRFILANGSSVKTFTPTIRIVFPTIASLSPASGKNTGGYVVTVSGNGFGSQAGSISISGSTVAITSWSDTTVKFTMPSVGDNTGAWNVVLRTAEDVATNAQTFTFTK